MSPARAIATLLLVSSAHVVCAADAAAEPSPAPGIQTKEKAGCMAATTNRIDPVTGAAVDIKVPILHLKLDGGDVIVGFANAANRKLVDAADVKAKQLYAQAAAADKMVKDGVLVDAPKAEPVNR